nr:hypothetical protein [uncultured Roseateles sp.]
MKLSLSAISLAATALALTACGGGSPQVDQEAAAAPTAKAAGYSGTVPAAVAPALQITAQPTAAVQAMAGAAVTWSIGASSNSGPISYQWTRAGVPINGATAAQYTRTIGVGDDGTDIAVVVSTPKSTITSLASRIAVGLNVGAQTVNTCQTISAPGLYRLGRNLTTSGPQACLSIENTSSVILDCGGFSVATTNTDLFAEVLRVKNVQSVSVRNCTISGSWTRVQDATDISVTRSVFNPRAGIDENQVVEAVSPVRMHFTRNRGAMIYQQRYSTDSAIADNDLKLRKGPIVSGLVVSAYSSGTSIIGNRLDGAWNGTAYDQGVAAAQNGADDGVVLQDEVRPVVSRNLILNAWDVGIEWVGWIDQAKIVDNQIQNAQLAAIGGWYWASLSNSVISRNVGTNTTMLFLQFSAYCLRPAGADDKRIRPADEGVYWYNNVYEQNSLRLTTPKQVEKGGEFTSGYYSETMCPSQFERKPEQTDYKFYNNVFRNNYFGPNVRAPMFSNDSAKSVVDGGGNICSSLPMGLYAPIACQRK